MRSARHNIAALAVVAAAFAGACRHAPQPSAPVTLAVEGRANAHVTLAAEGRRIAAAWTATSDATSDVYAAISDDAGAHFSEPVRVNDRPGDASGNGEQPPRIVIKDRSVTVVWVSKRDGVSGIRSAQSLDGGRTFSAARTISPPDVTGARGWESATVSDDGVVHAAWLDGRNAGAGVQHVHGAMRQDIVHAMWRGSDAVVETPVADNVCFCCKTGVVTHGSDVFVVWRHLFDGGVRDIAIARSSDGGRSFGAPVRVSADEWKIDACPDDGPSLAVDGDGSLRVAWPTLLQDGPRPHMAVFESISHDGGATFAPRTRVDASGAGASHPRIAVGSAGAYAIAWDEPGEQGRRVVVRRSGAAAQVLGQGSYPAVVASTDEFAAAWTESGSPSRIRIVRVR
jgi:hypothetical protein